MQINTQSQKTWIISIPTFTFYTLVWNFKTQHIPNVKVFSAYWVKGEDRANAVKCNTQDDH